MCEWQLLRSSLNHDWLKNEYIKNLDGLIMRMQLRRSIDVELSKEMSAYLSAWEKRHPEMENLLNTAEARLSPRSLFDKVPLVHCPPDHKSWLKPLIHGLWLVRYGVRTKVSEAHGLLSDADRSHGELKMVIKEQRASASITAALEAFTDIVKQLSRLLSSFPDKMVTV